MTSSWIWEFLAPVILYIITVIVPFIIKWTNNWIGFSSRFKAMKWSLYQSHIWVLIVSVLPAIGVTYLTQLFSEENALYKWKCFFLPESGSSLINLVIISAFFGNGAELLFCILRALVANFWPAMRKKPEFDFLANYISLNLNLSLTILFSLVCPLITPFGLIYAVVKYFIDRYKILYETKPTKLDKTIHVAAIKLVIVATLLQLIFMVVYSIIHGTEALYAYGIRTFYVTVLCTVAITIFVIDPDKLKYLPIQLNLNLLALFRPCKRICNARRRTDSEATTTDEINPVRKCTCIFHISNFLSLFGPRRRLRINSLTTDEINEEEAIGQKYRSIFTFGNDFVIDDEGFTQNYDSIFTYHGPIDIFDKNWMVYDSHC